MKTIAIIDDEINILSAITRLLRRKNWNLLTFNSSNHALQELMYQSDLNLIISDYRMPIMSGIELLNGLKQYCPGSLRILLSGQADLQGILAAINEAEIYRFITKPWIDEDFIVTIEKAIEYQELVEENLKLSQIVKRQSDRINKQKIELLRLESDCPGITKIKWNDDGSIDISDES